MVTKLIAAPKQDVHQQDEVEQGEYLAVFPEYPPRGDMNNPTYLHEPSHVSKLNLIPLTIENTQGAFHLTAQALHAYNSYLERQCN